MKIVSPHLGATVFFEVLVDEVQYCAKVMQTSFTEIRGFSWLYDEKILNFRWKRIDYFTVVCSVTWPLSGSEAGVDLVLIQTSLLLLCKTNCSDAN